MKITKVMCKDSPGEGYSYINYNQKTLRVNMRKLNSAFIRATLIGSVIGLYIFLSMVNVTNRAVSAENQLAYAVHELENHPRTTDNLSLYYILDYNKKASQYNDITEPLVNRLCFKIVGYDYTTYKLLTH